MDHVHADKLLNYETSRKRKDKKYVVWTKQRVLLHNFKVWSFELFKKIHDYSFSHFADEKYGEWYGYLHRDGTVSHTQKGSLWKGPYHLPRCLILVEKILESLENGNDLPDLL